MAITIQATPAEFSSLQDNLIYTVAEVDHTADPETYPNYKFIGDVYIDGELVARIKKVPDPITKIGIFNIGQIVRNYLTTVFNPLANNVLAQTMGDGEFSLEVTMQFGEEYSYTMFTNLVTDEPRRFYNNYNGRSHDTSFFELNGGTLTSRPLTITTRCDSAFNFLPFLATSTDTYFIRVRTYSGADSLMLDYTIEPTPAAQFDLHLLNFSAESLNTAVPGTIDDSIKYYTIEIDESGVIYRFNRECECVYEIFTLHFLNKFGGFESKDFTKVSRKTIAIEKKDFGKLPYTVDSSGVVSYKNANNVYNESRSVYSSQFKEKMVLNSDFLTDAEYRWLEQLVVSPMVYLEEKGSFYPVVISENNYEPKLYVNDELTNLTLNIEFGEQLNAQYR